MRHSRNELEAIREKLQKLFPDGHGFLFGSRSDNNRRWGDIDILVLTSQPVPDQLRRIVLLELEDRLGEQRIDLLVTPHQPEQPFVRQILPNCVPL